MTPPPSWLERIVSLSALLCELRRKTGCDRPTPGAWPWAPQAQWLWRKAATRDQGQDDRGYRGYIFRSWSALRRGSGPHAPPERSADTQTDRNYDCGMRRKYY